MRFIVLRYLYFTIIALIIFRLFYWQVLRTDDLTARAEGQRITSREIEAPRGEILFADGSILASTKPSFLVYIQPKVIEIEKGKNLEDLRNHQEKIAKTLAQIFYDYDLKVARRLEIINQQFTPEILVSPPPEATLTPQLLPKSPEEIKKEQLEALEKEIMDKLNKNLYWVSLNKKVDVETKNQIDRLSLTGVGFEQSTVRFYPEASSSAHLLGFVGSDSYGGQTGYFGVEGFYNGELRGRKGLLREEKDALGLPILIGNFSQREPKPGKTLKLNIDRTIQHVLEEKLKKGIEKYQAVGASAIVMDPHTGNILAMASYPNYDPSHVLDFRKEYFKNTIVADGYEPGSTFKVLVMAAGINEGLITPQTICDICDGPISMAGYTIRTWNNKYQPGSTMTDTIIHSDNTGMVFVSQKLGLDRMIDYIQKFGFGQPTGIDLQDETSPILREKKDWYEIDLATSSFGQGISVTTLQVVRAVSSIANGGKLMEPHVVSMIDDGKTIEEIKPKIVGTPLKPETTKEVTEMMIKAVDEGEAKVFKPKGYKIAGKTGTAQIPIAGHYDANKTIASFVGFAPAHDPKFVMLVTYNQPGKSIYGAETAAPTFFEIAKEIFNYYGIAPTEE